MNKSEEQDQVRQKAPQTAPDSHPRVISNSNGQEVYKLFESFHRLRVPGAPELRPPLCLDKFAKKADCEGGAPGADPPS